MEPLDVHFILNSPPEKILEYLSGRFGHPTVSWHWWEVWGGAHRKAWTVAKATQADVLGALEKGVQGIFQGGMTFKEFEKYLTPRLEDLGWWGKQLAVSPAGLEEEVQLGSPWRLKTIFRANANSGYAAGRCDFQMSNTDHRPYFQRLEIMDARTRASHRRLHKRIWRFDDPGAAWIRGPLDWGCRGRERALTEDDVYGLPIENSAGRVGEEQVPVGVDHATGEQIFKTVQNYRLTLEDGTETLFRPGPGWDYSPCEWGGQLDDLMKQKMAEAGVPTAVVGDPPAPPPPPAAPKPKPAPKPAPAPAPQPQPPKGFEPPSAKVPPEADATVRAAALKEYLLAKRYNRYVDRMEPIPGMEMVDQVAVRAYTDHYYYKGLNQALKARSDADQVLAEYRPLIQALDAGLEAMPAYQGKVYRGAKPRDLKRWIEGHQPGAVVQYNAYTSTSMAKSVAASFSAGSITMEIVTRTGRVIDVLSELGGEKEVLIPRGTQFRVLEWNEQKRRLKLEEVPTEERQVLAESQHFAEPSSPPPGDGGAYDPAYVRGMDPASIPGLDAVLEDEPDYLERYAQWIEAGRPDPAMTHPQLLARMYDESA